MKVLNYFLVKAFWRKFWRKHSKFHKYSRAPNFWV